jgi:predicted RNase H-like nuclease (RuvC/YqgF family)
VSDSPNNQAAALLVGIGELKGQMQAIHSHTERMDRQDERMDRQDERMNEFSRKLHEHCAEDSRIHEALLDKAIKNDEAVIDKVSRGLREHSDRIGKVELKIAYWSGGLFVVGAVLQVVLKRLGL